MKFRDAEQRARVCRALLTMTMDKERVDMLWTRRGPTDLAVLIAQDNFAAANTVVGDEHRLPRLMSLRLAWDVWNDGGNFKIADAMAHWDSHAWETLGHFCEALADDAAHDEDWAKRVAETPEGQLVTLFRGELVIGDDETALDAWVRSVETEHGWRKVDEQ